MSDRSRLVVVTGASRGLGRALALRMARDGDRVVVGWHTHDAEATETVRSIVDAGGTAFDLPFDVTDPAAVGAAFDAIAEKAGPVDVLVNNAGIASDGWFALSNAQTWGEVLAVDLRGAEHCSRAVLRSMLARKSGVIVNVASVAAVRAVPGQTAYVAAKAGLIGFTRALAVEVAAKGVRVNAVVPGLLDVGIAARTDRRAVDRIKSLIPLGRQGTADEVAEVVAFLASDAARYVVGQAIVVDGGLSL